MPQPSAIDWDLAIQCYAISVSTSLGLLCLSPSRQITARTLTGTFLLFGGVASGFAVALNERFAGTAPGLCFGVSAGIGAGVVTLPAVGRFLQRLLRSAIDGPDDKTS